MSDLTRLLLAIAASDQRTAVALLNGSPSLVTSGVARRDEFFLAQCLAQVYEGDTALHAAAFSYDPGMPTELSPAVQTSGPGTGGAPNRSTPQ